MRNTVSTDTRNAKADPLGSALVTANRNPLRDEETSIPSSWQTECMGILGSSRGGTLTGDPQMATFGTSAYIKILAQNPAPRDTTIRERLFPKRTGGYDFHKDMRSIVTQSAAGLIDLKTTRERLGSIRKESERASALSALNAFTGWLGERPITLPEVKPEVWRSPAGLFSVRFQPDFLIDIDGTIVRIHLWNTKRPACGLREAIGALGLFVQDEVPSSIGILSLQTGELYRPTDADSARSLARFLALAVEKRFHRILSTAETERETDKVDRTIRP